MSIEFSVFHPAVHFEESTLDLSELYEGVLQLITMAEDLGYGAFFLNEGHLRAPNFRLPNSRMLLAAAAQRTSRIHLGTALTLLAYHNPKLIAEDVCMLGALTQGRYRIGLGTGAYPQEALQFGLDPSARSSTLALNIEILRRLLDNEVLSVSAPSYKVENLHSSLPCPYPVELYRGTASPRGCRAVGEQGLGLMLSANDFPREKDLAFYDQCLAQYREGWSTSRRRGEIPPPHYLLIYTFVAETDADAFSLVGPYLERLRSEICGIRLPPGQTHMALHADDPLSLIGSVDTVTRRIAHLEARGAERIMTLQNIGAIPDVHLRASMQLFARQVVPRVRSEGAAIPCRDIRAAPAEGPLPRSWAR
ncbi:MAG: LLM class flavin-dependent oxidoreductase [Myxococcota bacterium]